MDIATDPETQMKVQVKHLWIPDVHLRCCFKMDMLLYGSQIVQSKLEYPPILMDVMKAAVQVPEDPQFLFCKPQAVTELVDVFRKALMVFVTFHDDENSIWVTDIVMQLLRGIS